MVKISVDSTADLQQVAQQCEISVMPLAVTLEGTQYFDGVDIKPTMIFDNFEQNKRLPKTAARGIDDYDEYFANLTADGSEVVHFAVSGEMSVSYNNAVAAARAHKGVYVVDSRSLSTGIGLLALKAYDYAKEGQGGAEIFDNVTALIPYVQASFVVDTMEFLHKGGRCNGVTAFVATAFKIHPQIIVKDGKMVVGQKFRGKMEVCIEKYVSAILKEFDTPDITRIFITHTNADEKIVERVKALVREFVPSVKEIIETTAGSTIASHCGKGTLGVLYINKA
ncbi:MAG: DegV family protein [Clostridiales bacterium]|nr:DegV family protein [Clostridiales bacterium]